MPDTSPCTLEDVRRALEVGLAKIEGRLVSIEKHLERTDNEMEAVESRVAALEKRVYVASGGAALIGMAVPYLAQTLGS